MKPLYVHKMHSHIRKAQRVDPPMPLLIKTICCSVEVIDYYDLSDLLRETNAMLDRTIERLAQKKPV